MRKIFQIVILVIAVTAITGCKTKRALEKSPLFPLSENALLDQITENSFQYNSLSAKLAVNADSERQSGSFKVNMRMSHDSIIWMSVTPALGIEAIRLLIVPDSIKYIDNLKDKYFVGNYNSIDSLLKYDTQFSFLENLLVGNPLDVDENEKYTTVVDDLYYVLQTKVKRKVKKAFDMDSPIQRTDTVIREVVKEKKYRKAKEKLDDEDLIIKKYYIRAGDFRIARTSLEDLLYQRSIIVEYNNFEEHNGVPLPLSIDIQVVTPTETSKFEIRYSRIKVNESQSYPFKIPSKYDPID